MTPTLVAINDPDNRISQSINPMLSMQLDQDATPPDSIMSQVQTTAIGRLGRGIPGNFTDQEIAYNGLTRSQILSTTSWR